MLQQNFWGETTKNYKRQSYALFPVSLRDILPKKTHLREWMKLLEGYFNNCISTVASLHGVNVKPLQSLFDYCWPSLCLPITRQQIPASSNMIGRHKYKAKESEMPRSPRFELVCHQTLEINLTKAPIYLKIDSIWVLFVTCILVTHCMLRPMAPNPSTQPVHWLGPKLWLMMLLLQLLLLLLLLLL